MHNIADNFIGNDRNDKIFRYGTQNTPVQEVRRDERWLGLPPVPFLPGRPVSWPISLASRRNPGRDDSCPVFSVTRAGMEMCGILHFRRS